MQRSLPKELSVNGKQDHAAESARSGPDAERRQGDGGPTEASCQDPETLEEAATASATFVVWLDCAFWDGGWHDLADLDTGAEQLVHQSIGWVISEDDVRIVIAPHCTPPEDGAVRVHGAMIIPKAAIIARREIDL